MRVRGALLMGVLVIVLGACASSVPGRFDRIGPVAQAANAAVKHMASVDVIHVTGTMVNAANVTHKVDIRATASGDMVGTIIVDGSSVQIVRLNSTLYVKSSAKYWADKRTTAGKEFSLAWENRWVKVDDNQFLIQLPQLLDPSYIAARISDRFFVIEPESVAGTPKLTEPNGAKVFEVATAEGKVFITEKAPHRITRIDGTVLNTGSAQPVQLSISAGDAAETLTTLQTIATTANQLRDPYDSKSDGKLEFVGEPEYDCDPAGCMIYINVKSNEADPLRAAFMAWIANGDTILSRCEPVIITVPPRKSQTVDCLAEGPKWQSYYAAQTTGTTRFIMIAAAPTPAATTCATAAVGCLKPEITAERLQRSFDADGANWFGSTTGTVTRWQDMITAATTDKKGRPWQYGNTATTAYLEQIDSKWLVVHLDRSDGDLVAAYEPADAERKSIGGVK